MRRSTHPQPKKRVEKRVAKRKKKSPGGGLLDDSNQGEKILKGAYGIGKLDVSQKRPEQTGSGGA